MSRFDPFQIVETLGPPNDENRWVFSRGVQVLILAASIGSVITSAQERGQVEAGGRPILVTIDESRNLSTDGDPVPKATLQGHLRDILKDRSGKRTLLVQGHPALKFADVAEIMDIGTGAGAEKIILLTEQPESPMEVFLIVDDRLHTFRPGLIEVSIDYVRTRNATAARRLSLEGELELTITRQGLIFQGRTPIGEGQLAGRIREAIRAGSARTVFLKIDGATPWSRVLEVFNSLRLAGCNRCGLLSERR